MIKNRKKPFLNLHNNLLKRIQINCYTRRDQWIHSVKELGLEAVWNPEVEANPSINLVYSNPEYQDIEVYHPKVEVDLTLEEEAELRDFYSRAFLTREDIDNLQPQVC